MNIDGRLRWKRAALDASAFIVIIAGSICLFSQADVAAHARAGGAQATSADPCRYVTAQEMGKAFGRSMQTSKLANVCQYRGSEPDLVVVKVETGPEGTILRSAKTASAQGDKGVEKVSTPVGEAYFDSILPGFIGRVGNQEVQIETTIQPVPREAMIAVGTRIMETLSGK